MSFLGGAECSSAANPLGQFAKHTEHDSSLQHDLRAHGRAAGALQESMRTTDGHGAQDSGMDEFLSTQHRLPAAPGIGVDSPAAMEQMRRQVEGAQLANSSKSWVPRFSEQLQSPGPSATQSQPPSGRFSADDFIRFQHMDTDNRTNGQAAVAPPTLARPPLGMALPSDPMDLYMQNGFQPYASGIVPGTLWNSTLGNDKGKGRMVELDDRNWEAQFAELEKRDQASPSDQDVEASLDAQVNAAMEDELNAETEQLGRLGHGGDELESAWRKAQQEAERAQQLLDGEHFGSELRMSDADLWHDFDGLNTLSAPQDPEFGSYSFEQDNLFRKVVNPFDEGMRIMTDGGNLSLAALAFEAALQKDPLHVEAWTKLGAAQAQNEKETPAIRALEQALTLEPDHVEALMGLAVSYVNEGYDSAAYRILERWVATKYPTVATEPLSVPAGVGFTDRAVLHEKVTKLFIRAAQLAPSGIHMDPDVQVGLGVLFYGTEAYDKAVDCFNAALASTESGTTNQASQVHLLWNRLGATLANSGRSEEAIDAYRRALTLRPNFVRARYNLGVSCLNIGCYEAAAGHVLSALDMHRLVQKEGRQRARDVVGGNVSDERLDSMMQANQSTNLYDTLRRVLGNLGRRDLADLVGPGCDLDRFRRDFDF